MARGSTTTEPTPERTYPRFPSAARQPLSLARWRARAEGWRWMLAPAGLAFGVRVLTLLVLDLMLRMLAGSRLLATTVHYRGLIGSWDVFDAAWYTHIARLGYDVPPPSNLADFFPLYPLLSHIVGVPLAFLGFPYPYILAEVIVSWLCFVAACVLLYRLALPRLGHESALLAITLLAVFPFSFFYGAPYTEAPYLLAAAAVFLAIERRRWGTAAIVAGLATALRPPGLFLGAVLLLAYGLDLWRARRRPGREALWFAFIPAGILAFCAYTWAHYGDFFAYQHAPARGWHGGSLQWHGIGVFLGSLAHAGALLNGTTLRTELYAFYAVLAVLFLALCVRVWRRFGPTYAFYVVIGILVPIATFPTSASLGRYLSVLFPVFFVVADAVRRRPVARQLVLVGSSLLLCVMALLFLIGIVD